MMLIITKGEIHIKQINNKTNVIKYAITWEFF